MKKQTASIERVTPEVARRMLATSPGNPRWAHGKMTHNRHVETLVRDMKAGRFHVAEAIQFDRDGQLRNGHHRLTAVIEADVAVDMVVVRGIDPAAVPVIDADRMSRSLDQSASAAGKGWITKDVAKTVRSMLAGMKTSPPRMTRQEQIDFAELHRHPLEFTVGLFPTAKRGLTVAPVLGAVARAWYHVDDSILHRFARVLYSGVPETEGERSVIRLRDFLMRNDYTGGGMMAVEIFAKACRTIQAVADDQELKALHAPSTDIFPLPEASNEEASAHRQETP